MYKFFGEKRKVINSVNGGIVFRFDNKGEFITDDDLIIERAKTHFDYIEMKVETVGKRVKVETSTPTIIITSNIEKVEGKHKCKKCEFSTDNQGELMAHYRSDHPKGG